jgi:hypothetical protein
VRYISLWRCDGKTLSAAGREELRTLTGRLEQQHGQMIGIDKIAWLVRVKTAGPEKGTASTVAGDRRRGTGVGKDETITTTETAAVALGGETGRTPETTGAGPQRAPEAGGRQAPSLRTIQADLPQRIGRTVSTRTIAQDLRSRS